MLYTIDNQLVLKKEHIDYMKELGAKLDTYPGYPYRLYLNKNAEEYYYKLISELSGTIECAVFTAYKQKSTFATGKELYESGKKLRHNEYHIIWIETNGANVSCMVSLSNTNT